MNIPHDHDPRRRLRTGLVIVTSVRPWIVALISLVALWAVLMASVAVGARNEFLLLGAAVFVLIGLQLIASAAILTCMFIGAWMLSGVPDIDARTRRGQVRAGFTVAVACLAGYAILSTFEGKWAQSAASVALALELVLLTGTSIRLARHIERIAPLQPAATQGQQGRVQPFGPSFVFGIVVVGALCGPAATLFAQAGEKELALMLELPMAVAWLAWLIVMIDTLRAAAGLRRRLAMAETPALELSKANLPVA